MKTYETGQPYPDHNRANGQEKTVIQTNTAFFDVLFYSSAAKEDAKFFGSDLLKLYLFEKENIPFICMLFPKQKFSLDASMNFHKVFEEGRTEWLQSEGNLITFYLIDCKTNILRSIRVVSVDFAPKFRQLCKAQLEVYKGAQQVEHKINSIYMLYSTDNMIKEVITNAKQ